MPPILLAEFVRLHPLIEIDLELSALPLSISGTNFDIAIRVGALSGSRLKAKLLAQNRRIVCAAPSYLLAAPPLQTIGALVHHNCIALRETIRTTLFGGPATAIKARAVSGSMVSDDGEAVTSWCEQGLGLIMRSTRHVNPLVVEGTLRHVLADVSTPSADIYALYHATTHPRRIVLLSITFAGACRPYRSFEDLSCSWLKLYANIVDSLPLGGAELMRVCWMIRQIDEASEAIPLSRTVGSNVLFSIENPNLMSQRGISPSESDGFLWFGKLPNPAPPMGFGSCRTVLRYAVRRAAGRGRCIKRAVGYGREADVALLQSICPRRWLGGLRAMHELLKSSYQSGTRHSPLCAEMATPSSGALPQISFIGFRRLGHAPSLETAGSCQS